MSDIKISDTIKPKSDQLNADDLLTGAITIQITKVALKNVEQPMSIWYVGDNNKPYKPCKGMRKAMYIGWGDKESDYNGRWLTLYRNPKVRYAGEEWGGIEISHMSHIPEPLVFPLTVAKGKKRMYTILPLIAPDCPSVDNVIEGIATVATEAELQSKFKAAYRLFGDDESRRRLTEAKDKRKQELANG
jgi:hypothetical protein